MIDQRTHTAYLTSSQAAARLGISAKTLLRAVRRGEVTPAYHTPRGFVRFAPSAVAAYAQRLTDPSPLAAAGDTGRATQ
jgi:excisionase family DNA binding protein